ncbi:MAG: hypothetical protein COZ59_01180 [Bacteroidetes bacterium CG_4_8_14_3_um_filter_31_14]|nr:MAG: hypothetical protein COZ59_01180 [Bacteroidetes bacterium CG_4_8_14_3_um_filter_31_14]
MFYVHCSLPTAYCLLLTAYCLLLTAYCSLFKKVHCSMFKKVYSFGFQVLGFGIWNNVFLVFWCNSHIIEYKRININSFINLF